MNKTPDEIGDSLGRQDRHRCCAIPSTSTVKTHSYLALPACLLTGEDEGLAGESDKAAEEGQTEVRANGKGKETQRHQVG